MISQIDSRSSECDGRSNISDIFSLFSDSSDCHDCLKGCHPTLLMKGIISAQPGQTLSTNQDQTCMFMTAPIKDYLTVPLGTMCTTILHKKGSTQGREGILKIGIFVLSFLTVRPEYASECF